MYFCQCENSIMAEGLIREIPNGEWQKYHHDFESNVCEPLPRFCRLKRSQGKRAKMK
jgi:hypothetical protein